MPFDLSSARPIKNGGFDISTARPMAGASLSDLIPGPYHGAPPYIEPERPTPSVGDRIAGVGEAALSAGTAATGGLIGMVGGAAKGLAQEMLSGEFGTPEAAMRVRQAAEGGAQALTYEPRTQTGQQIMGAVGDVAGAFPAFLPVIGQAGALTSGIKASAPAVAAGAQRIARPITQAIRKTPDAQVVPDVAAAEAAKFAEVGELAQKASGTGSSAAAAKAKLIDIAQINTDAQAAAKRLGFDLPADVYSDSPQVRAAVGLTRSEVGSTAEAAWIASVRNSIEKADEITQQFDAAFIEGRPAPGVTSQRIMDSLKVARGELDNDAGAIYERVNSLVPKDTRASMPRLNDTLGQILQEVGSKGFTSQEKRLARAVAGGMTYGRLLREKSLIGNAISGKDSPYGNVEGGALKRLYSALADDQLSVVGDIAGDTIRKELRAANLMTAKRKALEKRMVAAFGRDIDGSVATLMQSSIKSAAKGDATQFHKLMKAVPQDLRKETIATALASVSSTNRGGQGGAFGFAEFAKTYQGLRANPTVYKQITEALGEGSHGVLRDLYSISQRVTDARASVLTTGKANQALVKALTAESLVGRVMQNTMVQRGVTGAAAMVPGGGVIAPDIIAAMSKGNAAAVNAAGKMFASDEFQRLAAEAATKPAPSPATFERVAKSPQFSAFARTVNISSEIPLRIIWLQMAVQPTDNSGEANQDGS